jgi:hypothetical protein
VGSNTVSLGESGSCGLRLSLGRPEDLVGCDTVSLGRPEDLVGCDTVSLGRPEDLVGYDTVIWVKQSKTQCHAPEDLHLHQHSCKNLTSWVNTCIRA